ncbi:hypothetical protein PoMZ_05822, partial [Pyricularia oryzae]
SERAFNEAVISKKNREAVCLPFPSNLTWTLIGTEEQGIGLKNLLTLLEASNGQFVSHRKSFLADMPCKMENDFPRIHKDEINLQRGLKPPGWRPAPGVGDVDPESPHKTLLHDQDPSLQRLARQLQHRHRSLESDIEDMIFKWNRNCSIFIHQTENDPFKEDNDLEFHKQV